MEKIIEMIVESNGYVLVINGSDRIEISFENKTLDSSKLYKSIFENVDEEIILTYSDKIIESTETHFLDSDESQKSKIKSEGRFIFDKVESLLDSITSETNTLYAEPEKLAVDQ